MENEIEKVVPNNMVFGTDDSAGIIGKATAVAKQLAPIIEQAKLSVKVQGKEYVFCEGWTTMMAMLGVFPQVDYSRRTETKEGVCTYEARVTLRDVKGNIVGAGEALASSLENSPWGKKEFSIKSMAQTRATGKAARLSFSWIMKLAGYQACNAEEMITDIKSTPVEVVSERAVPKPLWADKTGYITAGQEKMLDGIRKDCDMPNDIFVDICGKYRQDVDLDEPASTWFSKNVFQNICMDMALASIKYHITKLKLTPTQASEAWDILGYTIDDVNLEFKTQYHFRNVLKALEDISIKNAPKKRKAKV